MREDRTWGRAARAVRTQGVAGQHWGRPLPTGPADAGVALACRGASRDYQGT